jgi:hypothetical protein
MEALDPNDRLRSRDAALHADPVERLEAITQTAMSRGDTYGVW